MRWYLPPHYYLPLCLSMKIISKFLFTLFIFKISSCNTQSVGNDRLVELPFSGKLITISILDSLSKKPVIGASVVFKSFNIGTFSDTLGNAILPFKRDSIIISSIGYKKTTISIEKDSIIKIVISPIFHNLSEVVVKSFQFTNEVLKTGIKIKKKTNFYKGGYGNQIAFQISSRNELKRAIISDLSIPIIKTTYPTRIKLEFRYSDNFKFSEYDLVLDTIVNIKAKKSNIYIELDKFYIDLFDKNLWCVITNLGTDEFIGDRYLNYKGQVVEPYYLITDESTEKTTYLNYLNRDWIPYPIIPNYQGIKAKTNLGYIFTLRFYK